MMTSQHIKEALSLRYVELLAAFNGYKTSSSFPDYGTDLSITEVDYRTEKERKRYFETGRELKFQLKATTQESVVEDANSIKYDLKMSTYNDLLYRRESRTPLLLILFILPNQELDWLKISDGELIVRKCAYWFMPEENEQINTHSNKSQKRISIQKSNLLTEKTLGYLFEKYS